MAMCLKLGFIPMPSSGTIKAALSGAKIEDKDEPSINCQSFSKGLENNKTGTRKKTSAIPRIMDTKG